MTEPAQAAPKEAAVPSPNIWNSPDVYEIENRGVDPDGAILAAMRSVHGWSGRRVLDLGCGSGFHLPLFAADAATVVGVEPHPPLVARARERVRDLPSVEVRAGAAQDVPLPDASVDIVHARWAYFFGPGCEPGLAEVERVLAPGGTAYVIDNDATRSTFGSWFLRAWPAYDPVAVERFWARHGWSRERVDMRWAFGSREDFEAVVRIEFSPAVADWILAHHDGAGVDYAVNLWHRTF
ncbi:class I SAM-dependent methyltransferase [Segeticoccus rhizosphaerae]|uniref:class I SAM-dependent methyltransferase n=1 Tax=Segeticoccus rhizosphaerae TaxID=1104777 RepID=UPI001EE4B072|nr:MULTISPECIES: class I SAM-dependent methyltransferase [Intrasporangiaceae]